MTHPRTPAAKLSELGAGRRLAQAMASGSIDRKAFLAGVGALSSQIAGGQTSVTASSIGLSRNPGPAHVVPWIPAPSPKNIGRGATKAPRSDFVPDDDNIFRTTNRPRSRARQNAEGAVDAQGFRSAFARRPKRFQQAAIAGLTF